MTILLTDDNVNQLASIDDVLPAVEEMFKQEGKGLVSTVPRERIQSGLNYLAYMGGANHYQKKIGMKIYSHCGDNFKFYVLLFDATSGELLMLTRADSLGRLRTAATSGIGAKYLSNVYSKTVAIIGSGYQAGMQLEAVSKVRSIDRIKVFSRTTEKCLEFAKTMTEQLGLSVEACSSSEEAVADADIVITITTADHPVIRQEWLKTGTTVIAPGNARWNAQEIDFDTIRKSDMIVVDTISGCKSEAGELMAASERGLFLWDQVKELSSVISGEKTGRTTDQEMILFKFVGMGPLDVVTAQLLYQKALAKNIGVQFSL